MTTIRNDRDLLLQSAVRRVEAHQENRIVPVLSAPKFSVLNGVVTPAEITITATLTGHLTGVPTFAIVSGISQITTSTPGQCTLKHIHLTADVCVIRITLTHLGIPYSTDVLVEGRVVPPADVGIVSVAAEPGKVRLSWPRNIEADLAGYEVRQTDSGWGDGTFLFHGNSTTCLLDPPLLSQSVTWFIRALDSAGLYSIASRTTTFTTQRPATVVGVTHEFATSSSSVLVSWAPSVPLFGIRHYRVHVAPSGATPYERIVNSPSVSLEVNWIGSCTITVFVVDTLGNESTSSTPLLVASLTPSAPGTVSATPTGTGLLLRWSEGVRTTLPIAGYELRLNNTQWGIQDVNFVWRGDAQEALVTGIRLGVNTFFINSYDINNRYSTTPRTVEYTVVGPDAPTSLQVLWNSTSTTSATVTVSWAQPPNVTFSILRYRVRITKPGRPAEEVLTDSTSLTTQADWVDTAEVRVWAIDVRGIESALFASINISKQTPTTPINVSVVGNGSNLVFTWPPAVKTTLPIHGYELRNNSAGWGASDLGLEWRGSSTTCTIPAIGRPVGLNRFFLRSFDIDSVYSNSSIPIDVNITRPSPVSNVSITYSQSATGNTATVRWLSSASMFSIARFVITIARAGLSNITADTTSNEHSFPVDWVGEATISVVAVDVLGNSSTPSIGSISRAAISQVGNITVTPRNASVELRWPEIPTTSLPIVGYEIRNVDTGWGQDGHVWRGTATTVEFFNLSSNTQTWFIRAYDTARQYSISSRSAVYTPPLPSAVTGLSGSFQQNLTSATAVFRWVRPSSQFDILRYNITLSTNSPNRVSSVVHDSTELQLQADWIGASTLSVAAVNVFGHIGPVSQVTLNKLVPSRPNEFLTPIITGTSIELDWVDNVVTSLPIAGYEIRSTDVGWGSSGFVWKGQTSSCRIDVKGVPVGTTITWFMRAYDTDSKYSESSRSISYTISQPANPSQLSHRFDDTNLTSASATVTWSAVSPAFGLAHYTVSSSLSMSATTTSNSAVLTVQNTKGLVPGDIVTSSARVPLNRTIISILSATQLVLSSGASITTGTDVITFSSTVSVNSTTLTLPADWLGSKTFVVRTVDMLGNSSTGVSLVVNKTPPNPAIGFRAQVIDNTVLLFWNFPSVTTLPIASARLKKGSTWNTAEVIGDKDGSFSTVTELKAGVYTYWIALIDTDNNESVPISISTAVSQPPDYVFNIEWTSSFTGTRVNSISENGSLVLPVDTIETFEGHFLTRSWSTPEAQIAAGFPIYIQPGLTTGTYEEVFDYGTVLGSSQVTVSILGANVHGTPAVRFDLSTSVDGVNYPNVFPETNSAFASNFRFIRVRITVTQNQVGQLYRVSSLTVRLDAKQITDNGTVTMSLGGAHPQGNLGQDYYSLWVPGIAMPPANFLLNGVASESAIQLTTGPGGGLEPVWACIDTDTAVNADGGWMSTSLSTISHLEGHIFAVFMQASTNNGVSTFGPSGGVNTILGINGAVNNDPLFWSGDLPALNTWYLIVGYVHPSTYGTTVTSHSGVYDLAGQKLANGTDFKYASLATSIGHRAFCSNNSGNTFQVVQRMARPVIIRCEQSSVLNTIQYMLTCATQLGSTVVPDKDFKDIISISATPQGVAPRSPVVDFLDVPNPRRFNIFNYNIAGTPSSGLVSWTARGY